MAMSGKSVQGYSELRIGSCINLFRSRSDLQYLGIREALGPGMVARCAT